MYADIEALVISGELFNGKSGSSSPERSPSPDKGWHDDELQGQDGSDYDSDAERRRAFEKSQQAPMESIGMGPGRTGVKGVIRDRDEAASMQREKEENAVHELRKNMEKSSLGGKTFLEEEREKRNMWGRDVKLDELVVKEMEKEGAKMDLLGNRKEGKFGHLREVGLNGFVSAVEKEERGVWVVVHLYDPSLDRCYQIDDELAQLARLYPQVKFLRARAAALGFASSKTREPPRPKTRYVSKSSRRDSDDDEDDPYGDDEGGDSDGDLVDEDDVDLDVLPTVLVYRDGELVHNWVRVDWEAGTGGIGDLLDRHHVLPRAAYESISFSAPHDSKDIDLDSLSD
ncbi:hypothetical protein AX16_001590 [Volvariella volvacea WC 439]|nr:hypothetical protein AX16_001590 [Volvariella volvacea WC 439]